MSYETRDTVWIGLYWWPVFALIALGIFIMGFCAGRMWQ
jgi:hypothetical protein